MEHHILLMQKPTALHHSYFDSALQDNNSFPHSICLPSCFERKRCHMQRVQNNFIRTVFKHSYSPNNESCQVSLRVPPIDMFSWSMSDKSLIKVKLSTDLLTAALDSSLLRQKSAADLLESHFGRIVTLVNNDSRLSYTVDNISDFIELTWRRK